jgi:glycosyltransferase involved in cell wall biosynthesis
MNARAPQSIRVLHLFSNAKWTGPAEPALNLCVALRALGVQADFACAPDAGRSVNKIVETARDRGVEPLLLFHLSKHRHPLKDFQDRWALSRYLRATSYDLIHCHLDNDHAIALEPAAKLSLPLVRSNYAGEGFSRTARHQKLLRGARFLIEPSLLALRHDTQAFSFPEDRMAVAPGAVDTIRFDPRRETPDGRRWLNIPPQAFVVGIVARLQTHRHYEDLFRAFRQLLDAVPEAHLVVVGRGTRQEQVGREPVQRLELEARVHFPGYLDGENYAGMLRAFDAGVYLVPGSDGTCRAAREIMAMGRPLVVTNRGMLPEIVSDTHDGLVVDGSVEAICAALRRLAQDRPERIRMGRAARETAATRYSLETQARHVLDIYRQILT